MPRVGFHVHGRDIPTDEALNTARLQGGYLDFPAPVWKAMVRQTARTDGFHLTPSGAGACLRQRLLQATEDYYVIPEKMWAILDGVSWHRLFEDGENSEQSLRMPLTVRLIPGGDYQIDLVGRRDHFDPDTGLLTDFKRTGSFGYRTKAGTWVKKDYPQPDHVTQVNLYILLERYHGREVNSADLFYFQSGNDAQRKLVSVPVWGYHEQMDTAIDLAIPIVLARETGELPSCTCKYGPGYLSRNLCEEVTNERWRSDGWGRLRARSGLDCLTVH